MNVEKTRKKKAEIAPSRTDIARPSELAREVDSMFKQFRRSFEDLLSPLLPTTASTLTSSPELQIRHPPVDLVDHGDHYTIWAELLGFSKDMVDVQVNKDVIEISAERKRESEAKVKDYLHRERAYSALQRTITFPEEIVPEKVEGTRKMGSYNSLSRRSRAQRKGCERCS